MHISSTVAILGALAGTAYSTSNEYSTCTAATRLHYAQQIPYAYNLDGLGESAVAFAQIPFGDPNGEGRCVTSIAANGLPAVPVAFSGDTTFAIAVLTRQVFSDVSGEYKDFGANGTVLITTDVTLGVRNIIPIPVTFRGYVYVDFTDTCRISAVRAFASIPTEVLGLFVDFPSLEIPGLTRLLEDIGISPPAGNSR